MEYKINTDESWMVEYLKKVEMETKNVVYDIGPLVSYTAQMPIPRALEEKKCISKSAMLRKLNCILYCGDEPFIYYMYHDQFKATAICASYFLRHTSMKIYIAHHVTAMCLCSTSTKF